MVCALLGLCNGLEDMVHHPEPDNSTPVVSTSSYCPFKVSVHKAVLIDTCASHPPSVN